MTEETNKALAKKNNFVELEFIGRNLTNNEVFDTNIESEAKKINPEAKIKPLTVCIGQNMVVKGLDDYLEGKELNKKYNLKLSPENAFGKRDSKLIRMIPIKMFLEQKIYPQAGMTLALDNSLVKVVSVSGGRVMVDFNNPLAGKDIEFEFTIKKIINDNTSKVSALQTFLFGQEFPFEVDESRKMIVFQDIKLTPILNMFRPKFQEILGLDVEILEKSKKNIETKMEEKIDSKVSEEKD